MKKKILYCASTGTHLLHFHLPYLKAFQEAGFEVWTAANRPDALPYADHAAALPFHKNLLSPSNLHAVFLARRLLMEQSFDLVSTHTTLASAVIRAAVLLLPKARRPAVFCTSHGYLFEENGGLKKWALLLPEMLCARVTDVLMVMNREDLRLAGKYRLYPSGGQLRYVNGMGVDLTRFRKIPDRERSAQRQRLGFSGSDFLCIYAAEFSKRKNHAFLIPAFGRFQRECPGAHLLLAGDGKLLPEAKSAVRELGLEQQVHFLGYRPRMEELYPLCDAAVSSSRIEGLPFNILEAMACGLPVAASRIKGHLELVQPDCGILFEPGSEEAFCSALRFFYRDPEAARAFGEHAMRAVVKYSIEKVLPEILQIYRDACPGGFPTRHTGPAESG